MEPMQTLLEEDCASLHRQGKEYWRNQSEVYSLTDKLCQVGSAGIRLPWHRRSQLDG